MVQQKMVMRLSMADAKKRAKALRTAVSIRGVVSVKLEDDKIVVVGDVDSVELTKAMRKKMGSYVELLSVAEEKKEEEEEKEEGKTSMEAVVSWPNHVSFVPHYVYAIPEEPWSRGSGCNVL